jgi:hypothetical protein
MPLPLQPKYNTVLHNSSSSNSNSERYNWIWPTHPLYHHNSLLPCSTCTTSMQHMYYIACCECTARECPATCRACTAREYPASRYWGVQFAGPTTLWPAGCRTAQIIIKKLFFLGTVWPFQFSNFDYYFWSLCPHSQHLWIFIVEKIVKI